MKLSSEYIKPSTATPYRPGNVLAPPLPVPDAAAATGPTGLFLTASCQAFLCASAHVARLACLACSNACSLFILINLTIFI